MQTKCFICGIGNDYFDTVPHGFETHTLQEHNLANYLWVHLEYHLCVFVFVYIYQNVKLLNVTSALWGTPIGLGFGTGLSLFFVSELLHLVLSQKLYKRDGQQERSPKVRPKHLNLPLVVGCSIGHKPLLLSYFSSGFSQTRNLKVHGFCHSNVCSSVNISVIWCYKGRALRSLLDDDLSSDTVIETPVWLRFLVHTECRILGADSHMSKWRKALKIQTSVRLFFSCIKFLVWRPAKLKLLSPQQRERESQNIYSTWLKNFTVN